MPTASQHCVALGHIHADYGYITCNSAELNCSVLTKSVVLPTAQFHPCPPCSHFVIGHTAMHDLRSGSRWVVPTRALEPEQWTNVSTLPPTHVHFGHSTFSIRYKGQSPTPFLGKPARNGRKCNRYGVYRASQTMRKNGAMPRT
jgi:hypothetical protein